MNRVFENYYFKVEFGGPQLMSGLPLPDPTKGPYKFVNCDFHAGLQHLLLSLYAESEFVNCHCCGFKLTMAKE